MNALDRLGPVVIGERLRVARANADLTQEQAATKLDLARTTLVAIEKGSRRVSFEELVAMAALYGVSHASVLRDGALTLELVPQFRRRVESKVAEQSRQAVRLLQRLAVAHAELEAALGVDTRPVYPPVRQISRDGLAEQAEDAALELRTHLGLGLSPIQDVVGLAESELGVRVFFRGIGSAISGVYAFNDAVGACVLLNAKHPRTRQDWTMAHELAHLLTDRTATEATLDQRDDDDLSEKFANLFAGAFLMPGALIRRRYRDVVARDGKFSTRHLVFLSDAFRVSPEAMCRRLERLSLLPAGTFDSLRDLGLSTDHVREVLGTDAAATPRQPMRLALLATEAYARDLVTEGELCDLLDLNRVALREVMDALGGSTNGLPDGP